MASSSRSGRELYIIASGGGHTGYAKAIVERIRESMIYNEVKLKIIIPSNDKWSYLRLKQVDLENIEFIQIPKPRGPFDPLYKSIIRIIYSLFYAYLRDKYRGLIITTGSNHSLIVALASILRNRFKNIISKKIINLEVIDRIETSSKTSKLLYRIGCPTILHWVEQKKNYDKGLVVGPIYEKPRYKPIDKGYILVTTGTIGHEILFEKLIKTNIERVVIQTGKISMSTYKKITDKKKWIVFRFDPDIDRWIANASLVITHQGLTAVNAALGYKKPVIIAYNPVLIRTSTFKDAITLARKINGIAIDPRFLSSEELEELIDKARKIKPLTYIDGARVFVEKILKSYVDI